MINKFTFYSTDWQSSHAIFNLKLDERGLYLELILLAYHSQNHVKVSLNTWQRLYNCHGTRLKNILKTLEQNSLIIYEGENKEYLSIPSVASRLKKINTGKESQKKAKKSITPPGSPQGKPPTQTINYNKETINYNKETINDNTQPETLPEKLNFSDDLIKAYNAILTFFPDHLKPKNEKARKNWLDTLEKTYRIDKIPFEHTIKLVEKIRQDDFWSKNFLSLVKLRKTNPEGIKFIVVWYEYLKNQKKKKEADAIIQFDRHGELIT